MLKIAVFVTQTPERGGGFQYELTLCGILQEKFSGIEFIYYTDNIQAVSVFTEYGIMVNYVKISLFDRICTRFSGNYFIDKLFSKLGLKYSALEKQLINNNVDLVYFLSPNMICAYLAEVNFILTVWDLCHRDQVEFPEIRNNQEFEKREKFLTTSLKKAVAVIVDSKLGQQNIVMRYGIDSARVKVISFIPPQNIVMEQESIDIKKKYNLESAYIFYPAQFWAHKNHIYILDALYLLKNEYNIMLYALFSGSDKGNIQYIKKYADNLGILEQIKFIGFVTSQELRSLYQQALALVMPTYFGPTNLPPLEAFQLECPVCYSDLPGLREQVGDAAFLLNLREPRSLTEQLIAIMRDFAIVEKKKKFGLELVKGWDSQRVYEELAIIIDDFAQKRKRWA